MQIITDLVKLILARFIKTSLSSTINQCSRIVAHGHKVVGNGVIINPSQEPEHTSR
jgi:hypothetical protein